MCECNIRCQLIFVSWGCQKAMLHESWEAAVNQPLRATALCCPAGFLPTALSAPLRCGGVTALSMVRACASDRH